MAQASNGRRRWVLIGVACAAIAGVGYGALQILPTVPLTSATLSELMEACAQVVTDQDTGAVSGYWLWPLESRLTGAAVSVEGGTVTILVTRDWRDNAIHSCEVRGDIWGKEASIRNPDVTWLDAQAVVLTWFAERVTQPGNVQLIDYAAGLDAPFAASCPDPAQPGFFLSAGPGQYGSLSADIAEPDLPMSFRASRAADAAQACGFVARAGQSG